MSRRLQLNNFVTASSKLRYNSTIMGCNISLIVLVWCWLPPEYMTVYGQQKFPRTYETRAFLTQRGYSYLVGTTGPVNLSDRCMRSYYLYVSGSEISHQLKYVEPESEEAETNSVEYYERHPKEIWLALFWHHNKKLLDVVVKGESKTLQETFHVVHANTKCLIIGSAYKAYGNKETKMNYDCTMWAKKEAVKRLPKDCEFIFLKYCNQPKIFLTALESECSDYYIYG
uniref:Lipocalin n=1 Tax=Rhipicephalus zambeziensis TaxID=60191 RepID=A0A224YN72_9ACAR